MGWEGERGGRGAHAVAAVDAVCSPERGCATIARCITCQTPAGKDAPLADSPTGCFLPALAAHLAAILTLTHPVISTRLGGCCPPPAASSSHTSCCTNAHSSSPNPLVVQALWKPQCTMGALRDGGGVQRRRAASVNWVEGNMLGPGCVTPEHRRMRATVHNGLAAGASKACIPSHADSLRGQQHASHAFGPPRAPDLQPSGAQRAAWSAEQLRLGSWPEPAGTLAAKQRQRAKGHRVALLMCPPASLLPRLTAMPCRGS